MEKKLVLSLALLLSLTACGSSKKSDSASASDKTAVGDVVDQTTKTSVQATLAKLLKAHPDKIISVANAPTGEQKLTAVSAILRVNNPNKPSEALGGTYVHTLATPGDPQSSDPTEAKDDKTLPAGTGYWMSTLPMALPLSLKNPGTGLSVGVLTLYELSFSHGTSDTKPSFHWRSTKESASRGLNLFGIFASNLEQKLEGKIPYYAGLVDQISDKDHPVYGWIEKENETTLSLNLLLTNGQSSGVILLHNEYSSNPTP